MKNTIRRVTGSPASRLAVPLLLMCSAVAAYADTNLFGLGNITIDPYYTTPAIAPFTAPCAAYNLPCTGSEVFVNGFPLTNLFGGGTPTAEGVADTIFSDGSSSPSGYDNVFFQLNSGQPLSGQIQLSVTGSTDGPGNPNRSFTYFDLYSYTFNQNAPLDASQYSYTLLFNGTPTVLSNGSEFLAGTVNLANFSDTGPYFIYQFGTDTSAPNPGARIFSVTATPAGESMNQNAAAPEPGLYVVLTLGLTGLFVMGRNRRRRKLFWQRVRICFDTGTHTETEFLAFKGDGGLK